MTYLRKIFNNRQIQSKKRRMFHQDRLYINKKLNIRCYQSLVKLPGEYLFFSNLFQIKSSLHSDIVARRKTTRVIEGCSYGAGRAIIHDIWQNSYFFFVLFCIFNSSVKLNMILKSRLIACRKEPHWSKVFIIKTPL